MSLLGAILAGGRSSRFGSDKAIADLAGAPMIVRIADLLAPYVDAVVICGHPGPPEGLTAIADCPRPGLGPLGGLAGALRHAEANGHAAVMSVGCDTPALGADLLEAVRDAAGAAFVRGCPIIGSWPAALAATLADHLAAGRTRSMRGWAEAIGAAPLDSGAPIPNLNTPDDLARYLAANHLP